MKRAWLLLLPLLAGLLWVGTTPTQAAVTPNWTITGVNRTGCADDDWRLDVTFKGTTGAGYIAHTTVTVDGGLYMNESSATSDDGDATWALYDTSSYGPTTGIWPLPNNRPMKIVVTLEKPKGVVHSSWTMITRSCTSGTILFNAADWDQDGFPDGQDLCPKVPAGNSTGCPIAQRTLSLVAKKGPKRVVGVLSSPGYPAFSAGRVVTVWKVRPGPDKKVAKKITNSSGVFKAKLGKGKYYAVAGTTVLPALGIAYSDKSGKARIR